MKIKVFASQTGGTYSLMQTVLPPGGGGPRHIHAEEDESNYVVDGALTMFIGVEVFSAGPGSYVVAPRGVTQRFINNGTKPCRFLTLFTPGGAEGFFKEVGDLAHAAFPGKPDPVATERLQKKYHLTYL